MAKKASKTAEDEEKATKSYMVISRNGTNPLSAAVCNAIDDGYTPIGGVSISSELVGRERVTTYHQALYMVD